jgi:hypothetical protein
LPTRNSAVILARETSKPGKGSSGLGGRSVGLVPDPSDWGVPYAGSSPVYPWRGFRLFDWSEHSPQRKGRWAKSYLLLCVLLNVGSTEHRSSAFAQAEQDAGNL